MLISKMKAMKHRIDPNTYMRSNWNNPAPVKYRRGNLENRISMTILWVYLIIYTAKFTRGLILFLSRWKNYGIIIETLYSPCSLILNIEKLGQDGNLNELLWLPRPTQLIILSKQERLIYGVINLLFTTISSIQRQEVISLDLVWTWWDSLKRK